MLAQLKALLDAGQRSTEGLRHSALTVQRQLVEYLPSGVLLRAKMGRLRSMSSRSDGSSVYMVRAMSESLQIAAAVALPGSAKALTDGGSLITIGASGHAQTAFQQDSLEDGMLVAYKNCGQAPAMSARECPIRVGRILRLVSESPGLPYVVIESWWPLLKPAKYEGQPNVFGTWIPCSKPIVEPTAGPKEKTNTTSKMAWAGNCQSH